MSSARGAVLRRFPAEEVQQGEKVFLRPYAAGFSQDESARLYRWSRDKEVLRWSGGEPMNIDLREFAAALRDTQRWLDPSSVYFLIFTRSGELIGRIGCYEIDRQRREAQLGILIGEKAYWGLGYGRDAINTLLGYIFSTTDLERLYLSTFVDNLRAQRCFASCGFRPTNSRRRSFLPRGTPARIEMEITRQEWGNKTPMTNDQIPND